MLQISNEKRKTGQPNQRLKMPDDNERPSKIISCFGAAAVTVSDIIKDWVLFVKIISYNLIFCYKEIAGNILCFS